MGIAPCRVSIVIPTYNAASTLGGAITGALTQTHPDVEVIVVVDGSPDDSAAIARAYGDRVRVVEKENGGVSSARNAGVAVATGGFVAFCDADDILLPPAVEGMLRSYHAAGGGRRAVTCNAYPLTMEGINPRRSLVMSRYPAPEQQRLEILRTNFVSTFTLFPRTVFTELGGYDESLPVLEDWDLWLRTIHAGVEFAYEKRPLALYRWSVGSLSSDRERLLDAEDVMLSRFRDAATGLLTDEERTYLDARLGAGSPYRMIARADDALRDGRTAEARTEYRRAATFMPGDRKLKVRAFSLAAPGMDRVWRARAARIEAAIGRKNS